MRVIIAHKFAGGVRNQQDSDHSRVEGMFMCVVIRITIMTMIVITL